MQKPSQTQHTKEEELRKRCNLNHIFVHPKIKRLFYVAYVRNRTCLSIEGKVRQRRRWPLNISTLVFRFRLVCRHRCCWGFCIILVVVSIDILRLILVSSRDKLMYIECVLTGWCFWLCYWHVIYSSDQCRPFSKMTQCKEFWQTHLCQMISTNRSRRCPPWTGQADWTTTGAAARQT